MIKNWDNLNKTTLPSKNWAKPHIIFLAFTWLISNILVIYFLVLGLPDNNEYKILRYVLHIAYDISIIWFLMKSGLSADHLPEIKPFIFPRWRYGKIYWYLPHYYYLLSGERKLKYWY